ncbi:MAG: DUF6049 family protein [Acidimicrobiia bacterium]
MRGPAAAATALFLLLLLPANSAAQDNGSDGDITLLSQTPWVDDATNTLELRLRVTADSDVADELFIRAATHARVRSRSAFQATLDQRPRTSSIDVAEVPLRDVTADESGALVFPVPIIDATAPGVYPLRVELRSAEGVPIDGFTTHLVRLPARPDPEPLRVALVLPFHAPPALLPDGSVRLAEQSARNLADVAVSLARRSLPLNVLATPETIEALDDNVVAALAGALPGRSLLGRSYVPTDPPSLVAENLQSVLSGVLGRGNATLSANLKTQPEGSTWVDDTRISPESAAELRALGVSRFVLPKRDLSELSRRTTLTAPFEIDLPGDDDPLAVELDAAMAAHFDAAEEDPVLAAHHLLADLAVVAAEAPGTERGVVVAADRPWPADAAFVETLLAALDVNTGILRPVRMDEVFDVPAMRARRGVVVRRITEPDAAMSLDPEALTATRARVGAFANLVGPGSFLPLEMDSAVLTSLSVGNTLRVHRAYLAGVDDRIRGQLSLIQAPEQRSITLAARRGEIPVTVRNGAPYPVRVRVRLDSDTLQFPEGEVRELELEPGAHTERFAVEARSSGAFRLRVLVESPDGALQVASTRFTIRSTATSGVGLALSIGAGGFLLVWWASHMRGRRSRRLVPA